VAFCRAAEGPFCGWLSEKDHKFCLKILDRFGVEFHVRLNPCGLLLCVFHRLNTRSKRFNLFCKPYKCVGVMLGDFRFPPWRRRIPECAGCDMGYRPLQNVKPMWVAGVKEDYSST